MKRLADYSEKELAALADIEADNLIDIECAFQGVPLLPKLRPTEPSKPTVEFDQVLHEVLGTYFVNQDDAQKVADIVNASSRMSADYDWSIGSEYRCVGSIKEDECRVKSVKVFSKERFSDLKVGLTKYKDEKSAYEEQTKELQKIDNQRKDVATAVWDAVGTARRAISSRQQKLDQYQRYLDLASGDSAVALKFFCDALKISAADAFSIINEGALPSNDSDEA